jgi:hypothetical protein
LASRSLTELKIDGWRSEYSSVNNVLRHLQRKSSGYGGLSIDTRLILHTVLLPAGAIGFLLLDRARKPKLSGSIRFYP